METSYSAYEKLEAVKCPILFKTAQNNKRRIDFEHPSTSFENETQHRGQEA
jgi:hypothetical protein